MPHARPGTPRFTVDRSGSIAVMMAFAVVPLLLFVGVAVDYARLSSNRVTMQTALDTAVVIAAKSKEKGQADWQSIAKSFVADSFPKNTSMAVDFQEKGDTIYGTLSVSYPLTISSLFGQPAWDVAVDAAVRTQNTGVNTCILLLSPNNGLNMSGSAEISASCGVQVNASGFAAVNMSGTARIITPAMQAVGMINRLSTNVIDVAAKASKAIADPMAALPEPPLPAGCSHVILSGAKSSSLPPQRYCSFLVSGGNITLQPGIHIFDGSFAVSGTGSITGKDVLLYFTTKSNLNVSGTNTWTITASRSGTYAGVAIFMSRAGTNWINLSGTNTFQVGGVLYGPTATLNMSGFTMTTPIVTEFAMILQTINMSTMTKLLLKRPVEGCATSTFLPAALSKLCSSGGSGGEMRLVN